MFQSFAAFMSETLGDQPAGIAAGLLTGLLFGVAAQRSGFCLRSAAIEAGRGRAGPSVAIWLLALGVTIAAVQLAHLTGVFDPASAQIMGNTGSLSGAIIGGLIFGAGMVLARGCSGRMIVLAASGNLRTLVAGLVFALTAQATMSGFLSPLRMKVGAIWSNPTGQEVDLLAATGTSAVTAVLLGVVLTALALALGLRSRAANHRLFWAALVGLSVALGWVFSFSVSQNSFEPSPVTSVSFSAPSANMIMYVLSYLGTLDFNFGLVPGAFIGAFLAALLGRDLKLEGYGTAPQMLRSVSGGALMGFGGVIAGGCAIGAGLSGTAVFAATLWLATACFILGAWVTDRLIDKQG